MLVGLLVVLAAELSLRALAGRLPEPVGWKQRDLGLVVERMEAVARSGRSVDVAFLGSSAATFAFEPDELADETGLRGFVAGMPGASVTSLDLWAREMVVPLLRPRMVVIALTSREMNANAEPQRRFREGYLDSPERRRLLGTETAGDRLRRIASEHSAVIRYRSYLRRPAAFVKNFVDPTKLEGPIEYGPNGEPRWARADAPYSIPVMEPWRHGDLTDFDVTEEAPSLDRLIRFLRTEGIEVVLVELPVVESLYVGYHPRGAADLRAFRTALAERADMQDVPLVGAPTLEPIETWFVDDIHLNRAGAARFTRWLARRLPTPS